MKKAYWLMPASLVLAFLMVFAVGCNGEEESVAETEEPEEEVAAEPAETEQKPEKEIYYVSVKHDSLLYMRQSPGSGGKPDDDVVGELSRRDEVEVLDKHDNSVEEDGYVWWEVYDSKGDQEGWVASEFLFDEKPEEDKIAIEDINFQYIKDNIQVGLTKKKVKELLGNSFTEVMAALDGKRMWRYDYPYEEGYVFETHPDQSDAIDSEGLKSGAMRMQLFISWSHEDKIEWYTVYTGDNNRNLYEYRVFPDGTARESEI